MSRCFPIAALALFPLLVAGCENKPAPAPAASAAKTAAPAVAASAAGSPRIVGFELASAEAVGALQFDVKYTSPGRFVGDADAVACEVKVDEALSSYNHIFADKNLRLAFVAVKGFSGPGKRIGQCQFQGDAKPQDFTITVRDASTPELEPVDPPPTVHVVLD
jgi:hypothetical protein